MAIPLAAAGQVLTIIVRTIRCFQHAADKAAGNLTAISWIHVSSLFCNACGYSAVIVALSVGTGGQNMLNAIPEVVINGLKISPAHDRGVGYAMVINMMRAGYPCRSSTSASTAAFTNLTWLLWVIGTEVAVPSQLARNTTA